jgi:hypothetical protein
LKIVDETLSEIYGILNGEKVSDKYDEFEGYCFDDDEDEDEDESDKHRPIARPVLDFSKNKLKRIFNNGSFEEGGRFYSVWWQSVPSRYRSYIAIDDRPTIEVDFSGIHINLLYMMEGVQLPKDDVYTIEGLPKESRSLLKVALQIILNTSSEAKALDSIIRKFPVDKYKEIFEAVTHKEIIEKFTEKHKEIANHFYKRRGVHLQYRDSQIAEDILLELAGKDIVALPVHDSFIVAEEYGDILRQTMAEVVEKRYGQTFNTKEDPTAYERDVEILCYDGGISLEDTPTKEKYEEQWVSVGGTEYEVRKTEWKEQRGVGC